MPARSRPLLSWCKVCLDSKTDFALAAFGWALFFSTATEVVLLPWEAPAAAACMAWLMSVINTRQQSGRPLSPIAALPAVGLALLTYTGLSSYLLSFFFPAFLLHFLTRFFHRPFLRDFGNLAAIALSSAAPAYAYSFEISSVLMVGQPLIWMAVPAMGLQDSTTFVNNQAKIGNKPGNLRIFLISAIIGIGGYSLWNEEESTFTLILLGSVLISQLILYAAKHFAPSLQQYATSPLWPALFAVLLCLPFGMVPFI